MALRRLGLLLVQTARSHRVLTGVIIRRKGDIFPVPCGFSVYPNCLQLCHLKHTDSAPHDDVKTNIVALISQSITSVAANSLLYYVTAFHRILDLMFHQGFNEKLIVDLFLSVPKLLNIEPALFEEALRVLYFEGFSVNQIILVLKQSPHITASINNVADVIAFLRDVVQLPHSNLQDVLTKNQALLFVPGHELSTKYDLLLGVFRRSDIIRMLRQHPLILLQGVEEIEAKVNYVNHKMGLDQVDMVWANILRHSLKHIRLRHQCMIRSGHFEKPDKTGSTHKPNPYLKDILGGTDAAFVKTAGITLEEFDVLGRLLEVEREYMLEEYEAQLNEFDVDDPEGFENAGYVKEKLKRKRMKKKILY